MTDIIPNAGNLGTTAYERLHAEIAKAGKTTETLNNAIEKGNLDNYATVSSLEEKANKNDVRNTTNILNTKIEDIESEKANRTVTESLQNQINNLVLQSGNPDASSAEIVQARGEFSVLASRLDSINNIATTGENIFSFEWELGTLSSDYGWKEDSDIRIRTVNRIHFNNITCNKGIKISISNGYKVIICEYTGETGNNGTLGSFTTEDFIFYPKSDCYYKFVIGDINNGVASLDYSSKVSFICEYPTKEIEDSKIDINNIEHHSINDRFDNVEKIALYGKVNIDGIEWELGTLNANGGYEDDSTIRIRTVNRISFPLVATNKGIKISISNGYKVIICEYTGETGNNGTLGSFTTEDFIFYPKSDCYYKFVIGDINNGVASLDYSSKVSFTLDYANEEIKNSRIDLNEKNYVSLDDRLKYMEMYIEDICKIKSENGFYELNKELDARVDKYINENGYYIDGVEKTKEEIKDWILNRNNFKYRGKLHKSGQKLLDKNNKEIELLGVGLHDLLDYKSLHTKEVYETLKYYGVNCIRLSAYIKEHSFVKSDGVDGTKNKISKGYIESPSETKQIMDEIIRICTELGFYIIVDWHIIGNSDGSALQYVTYMKEFFTYFSNKYSSNGNIIYEILNEPFGDTASALAPIIGECITLIKSNTDAVLVCGIGNDGAEKFWEMVQNNNYDIFISPHYYTASDYSWDILNIDTLYNAGAPIFSTEWGNAEGTGDGETHDDNAIEIIEKYHSLGISHCVWKFTYQNMPTGILRYSPLATFTKYKYGGFLEEDLSHNGKLYFKYFKQYNLD